MAKKVPEDERIVIAERVRSLLATETPTGAQKWTQSSLGKACGVSQETIRRALEPAGVTPAVRAGILGVTGKSMEELLDFNKYYLEHLKSADPSKRHHLHLEARDRAVEILVRQNRSLGKATRAVEAAATFKAGEEPDAKEWAELGDALIRTEEALMASRSGKAPAPIIVEGRLVRKKAPPRAG